jgi:hypothetical protein
LILAALEHLDERELPKLTRIVVVVSVRYSIIGSLGTGNIEKAYSDAAIEIRRRKADTAAKVFHLLKPVIYPDDARFKSDFAEKSITKAKLARYLLTCVANAMQPQTELAVLEDEQKVTLEHVMPKTPSGEWSAAAPDDATYYAYVDRLGNMTLIEDTANGAAGNASFTVKKRTAFSASDIIMTKQLCDYSTWTTEDIERRQLSLAERATSVWSVNY